MLAILLLRDRFHAPEHDDVLMPTIGYTVVAIGFAGTIILSLASLPGTLLGNLLFHPALRFVGRHSYALYVFHPIIITQMMRIMPSTHDNSRQYGMLFIRWGVVFLIASIALAWLTWHAWEKHFLRMKHHFEYKTA